MILNQQAENKCMNLMLHVLLEGVMKNSIGSCAKIIDRERPGYYCSYFAELLTE